MGLFDWLGTDPSKASKKYLDKVPGTITPYYEPFINAGKNQLPGLEEQYGNLMNDPGAMLNKFGESYQKSPGFDFALQQALQGAGNAAAAGGMAGSPMHEQQNMGLATNLANQDYNNYLSNAMSMYGKGLSGSQDLYGKGMSSSDALARMLEDNLNSQASNAFGGAQWKNKMNLGLTGLGLTGAADLWPTATSGGNMGGASGGSAGGADLAKYLPMLMSMGV